MRVVQVLGSSAGGVTRHVAQVAELLVRGGQAEVLVAGPSALRDRVASPGSGIRFAALEIAERPRLGDIGTVLRLRRLVRGTDVVHAHGLRAGAFAAMAVRGLRHRPRLVVTLHNLPVGGGRVQAVSAVLARVVARGTDVVLGVSGDIVRHTRARGAHAAERALVPAPAARPAYPVGHVRERLGLQPGEPLVVTVARLAPQKGLDVLADAAGLLAMARQGRPVTWAVVGGGPLEEHLRARVAAERLPVVVLGERADAVDLLAAAYVVVSTAVWEGQPIAVQEALAVGVPLVVTDAGGTREVTGDAAVVVPVGDAGAVAAAVAGLLDDEPRRASLARASLARAAELPGPEEVLEQLVRVYGAAT
ncbi:glycosyltransferase family 4 protein [Cellulomonas hominis]